LEKKKWIFLTNTKEAPNSALVEYWRSSFTIINSRLLSFVLQPLTFIPFSAGHAKLYPLWEVVIDEPSGPRTVRFEQATNEVNRRYEARYGNQSVITLTDEHQAAGQRALRNLGIPPGSWWVTLHVREYATKTDASEYYRNADIRGHFKAMEYIVRQGGWVIRVGDPSMTPLPKLDGVVDWVHTDAYADWMDLFLNANCRFQLGSDSGANLLPILFGRPLVAVNWELTLGQLLPDSSSMLFIQKMLRDARDGRLLPFSEVYEKRLGHGFITGGDKGYKRLDLELVDNTPDEILEITKEMFERLNGTARYTAEDECLQEEYLFLYMRERPQPYRALSRVGREFLRRHKHLLTSPGATPTRPLPPGSTLPACGPAEKEQQGP
jgi:putative glycosyltransferase (TIGR04372 family)